MKLLDFIDNNRTNCTGCTACLNKCPKQCIHMEADEEGFLYPFYDEETCIDCGLCCETCPLQNGMISNKNIMISPDYNYGRSKDDSVWKVSTSGGAFTEICNVFGNSDTIVFGAEMDKCHVKHSFVEGIQNIGKFRLSKYVQSDMGDNFTKVKTFLKQGRKVIFSGTPCQISGLNSYLGKEYDNLLRVEFVCHGVGSPAVFERCVDYIGKKKGRPLKNYLFRSKRITNGVLALHVSRYEYADRKDDWEKEDVYDLFFVKQLCLRRSCMENCQFRHKERNADITLGDYRGPHPNVLCKGKFRDWRNYSHIVFNTEKAFYLKKSLSERMFLFPMDEEDMKKQNPLFFYSTKGNSNRNKFFDDFVSGKNIEELKHQFVPVNDKGTSILALIHIAYRYARLLFLYAAEKMIKQ